MNEVLYIKDSVQPMQPILHHNKLFEHYCGITVKRIDNNEPVNLCYAMVNINMGNTNDFYRVVLSDKILVKFGVSFHIVEKANIVFWAIGKVDSIKNLKLTILTEFSNIILPKVLEVEFSEPAKIKGSVEVGSMVFIDIPLPGVTGKESIIFQHKLKDVNGIIVLKKGFCDDF